MYNNLFKPGKIGNVELKNRIFKPAAQSTPCFDGRVSERLVQFYEEEAKGGTGLIIVGLVRVSPHETPEPSGSLGITDDTYISGFGSLTQAIHDNGAKCAIQLAHFGSHAYPPARCVSREGLENDFWLPEHHPGMTEYPHEEYSIDEIHELVKFYGDAAVRAVKAGFDMIEVHAGHRHGLGLFVSPLTNHRTDEYGGTMEKRARILFEVVEEIQSKIGNEVPLIVRLNGSDQVPGGQEIDAAVFMARELEKMGVAAINMSNQFAVCGMEAPLGVHAWAAETVKKEIHIPVLSCGSNNTPEIAEETLASGKADFVGTGRALYADPYWPKKARAGKKDDIRPCIRCLECVGPKYSWAGPLVCSVNPRVGKENMLSIDKVENDRKVAVIGGGVAGMEAALVCAQRGYEVTVYEKRKLGGRINEASVPHFKEDLRRLLDYYTKQIEKNVQIKVLYMEATAEELKDKGYSNIIVATGGQKIRLRVPGIEKDTVMNAIDVLREKPELGEKVVIIGGGTVGVETGIWLAEQGKEVSIVEMTSEIMDREYPYIKNVYKGMLSDNHIKVYTEHKLTEIGDGYVIVLDAENAEHKLETDNVIISAGLRPDTTFHDQLLAEADVPVYAAGDCIRPRKVFDAIHEGNIAARDMDTI